MDTPEFPPSLSRALADWRVTPSRNPQFRAAIRERIGPKGAAMSWQAYARRHGAALAGAVTLALVTGALLGRERAKARTAAESARLAAAYVQALDARSMH